jgi:hypothetical protein
VVRPKGEPKPPSVCFVQDYLLSLPPPDGLPVVLGHPPLPLSIVVVLWLTLTLYAFGQSAPSVLIGLRGKPVRVYLPTLGGVVFTWLGFCCCPLLPCALS